jgi:glycosyltransferase involved in cell wall biosynthesis
MNAPAISALVVARNEEARLDACLASLRAADELVVVLDRSTDRSAEIARAHGARVIEGAWALEGERRNTGIAACAGPWVLEIDADEQVPDALWPLMRQTIAATPHSLHPVRIDNYVGDQLVLYGWGGSFGTTTKNILFRKGAKTWRAQRVHPGVDWTGTTGAVIDGLGIHHAVDRDISDMLRRLDSYSSAKAADLLEAGEIGTLPDNVRRFFSRFLKCYVSRQGYKGGGFGFLVSLCAGLFPLLAHLKARLEPDRYRAKPMDPD